jgi:hypothetical protein
MRDARIHAIARVRFVGFDLPPGALVPTQITRRRRTPRLVRSRGVVRAYAAFCSSSRSECQGDACLAVRVRVRWPHEGPRREPFTPVRCARGLGSGSIVNGGALPATGRVSSTPP